MIKQDARTVELKQIMRLYRVPHTTSVVQRVSTVTTRNDRLRTQCTSTILFRTSLGISNPINQIHNG